MLIDYERDPSRTFSGSEDLHRLRIHVFLQESGLSSRILRIAGTSHVAAADRTCGMCTSRMKNPRGIARMGAHST